LQYALKLCLPATLPFTVILWAVTENDLYLNEDGFQAMNFTINNAGQATYSYVLEREALTASDMEKMFQLMSLFYENVNKSAFQKDLLEKQWIILLRRSHDDDLVGFTTLLRLRICLSGKWITGVFSGDTIIHNEYWQQNNLFKSWIHFTLQLARPSAEPFYWFLICKGYKTYRFLPIFFKNFFPCLNRQTPAYEQSLIDAFAYARYPGEYNPATGVITHTAATDRLKAEIGFIDARRLRNSHVAFFARKNPDHSSGDELACLCQISVDNLTRAGQKLL
jgi:hypothetical protein